MLRTRADHQLLHKRDKYQILQVNHADHNPSPYDGFEPVSYRTPVSCCIGYRVRYNLEDVL